MVSYLGTLAMILTTYMALFLKSVNSKACFNTMHAVIPFACKIILMATWIVTEPPKRDCIPSMQRS